MQTTDSRPTAVGEWRVVLVLIALLLVAEMLTRCFGSSLSRDFAAIRNLPAVASSMSRHQGHKVLIVGNSLTRRAIVPELLRAGLARNGSLNPELFFFTPDGTSMVNWRYGLQRFFFTPGHLPDEIFVGIDSYHTWDARNDAARLGASYVDDPDLLNAWRDDAPDSEARAELIAARLSAVYASRQRVKPHVFGGLIPHYYEVTQWLNQQRHREVPETVEHTHRHFDAIIDLCWRSHVSLTFFQVPLPQSDADQNKLDQLMAASGEHWLPLARKLKLQPGHFADGYHLSSSGADLVTQELVKALSANAPPTR